MLSFLSRGRWRGIAGGKSLVPTSVCSTGRLLGIQLRGRIPTSSACQAGAAWSAAPVSSPHTRDPPSIQCLWYTLASSSQPPAVPRSNPPGQVVMEAPGETPVNGLLQHPRGWTSSRIPWHKSSSKVWISVLGCRVLYLTTPYICYSCMWQSSFYFLLANPSLFQSPVMVNNSLY